MVRLLRAILTLALAALVLPAGAGAQQSIAPPGNSGIDEYRETVPDAAGGRSPRPRGESGPAALSDAQRRRLARLGADGRQLADVIDQTAPDDGSAGGSRGDRAALPDAEGDSPLPKVIATLGDDEGGGLGIALPVILALTLATAALLLLLRRRRASE